MLHQVTANLNKLTTLNWAKFCNIVKWSFYLPLY